MRKNIKILALALCLTLLLIACLSSCGNKDMFDTVYTFDYALVEYPDGTSAKIEIENWTDFEDADQIQITSKDGTVYLFHSSRCVLVKEGN